MGLADGVALHGLLLDVEVRRYLLDGNEVSRDWVEAVIRGSQASFADCGLGLWAVREKAEPGRPRRSGDPLLGLTGFREFHQPPALEVLWALLPAHWHRGFATEMARGAIDFAFERAGLERVRASTDAPNQASLRVMERLGMRPAGRSPGEIWEQVHYEIERADWTPAPTP